MKRLLAHFLIAVFVTLQIFLALSPVTLAITLEGAPPR